MYVQRATFACRNLSSFYCDEKELICLLLIEINEHNWCIVFYCKFEYKITQIKYEHEADQLPLYFCTSFGICLFLT